MVMVFIGVMIDGHHKVVMVMVFIGVMIDGHHKIVMVMVFIGVMIDGHHKVVMVMVSFTGHYGNDYNWVPWGSSDHHHFRLGSPCGCG